MALKFEQLRVFQKSLDLSDSVNNLVKKFPKEELYILVSQIKKASDSITLNIAESSTGQSNAEFKKFLWLLNPFRHGGNRMSASCQKEKSHNHRRLQYSLY